MALVAPQIAAGGQNKMFFQLKHKPYIDASTCPERIPGSFFGLWRISLCIVLGACLLATASLGDEFTNLEELPKDISRRELMETMKGYARNLGVRCHHCHTGEEGLPLAEFDFTADSNPNKDVARAMIRMTRQINESLSKIGRDHVLEVSCATCHHGQARPVSLEQSLAETLAKDGLPAALERYRTLRAEWYGRSTYDFGEATLRRLAEQVSADGKSENAIAFLQLNIEHYPDDIRSLLTLARLYKKSDQEAKALETYRRVLGLDPANAQAAKALQESTP